ncbi:MAG: ribonucleoside-diphosphate reductase subunit alpha [Candidatus Pacebacteria bacterium]|jgi:ribonucleoside-diphosphate reductase alpha chain|nr:ribonucleoside-diphosphate reductase subunit alpha [Candidatus Paceibacterota bacterium]
MITHIKKRNGMLALFEVEKITSAMEKAFLETGTEISKIDLGALTLSVVRSVELEFEETKNPGVEDIQNIVEKVLMEAGYFETAKAYILYRHEREQKRSLKNETPDILVLKRSGKKEPFSEEKIRAFLAHQIDEIRDVVDEDAILKQFRSEIYDGISTVELTKALIMTVRSFIEMDPAYSSLAAKLVLADLYKEVLGEKIDHKHLNKIHTKAFRESIEKGVHMGRLDKKMLDFDLGELGTYISLERDSLFAYLGIQTLYDRYFVRDPKNNRIIETPQMFWMRIAMGSALNEKGEYKMKYAKAFYDIMSQFLYTPSTPTLFHAGTTKPQLSSCYLNTVPDDLSGIFKNFADNSQLSKWSGGIGTDWTNIRGTGAYIRGTGVESQGVIPFIKIANDVTVAINRSGRRRGAAVVYLETWHYDILDFLELRKNTGDDRRRTHDMDTANWVPDLFMKRVRDGAVWTLFSPDETPELHHIYGKAFDEKYREYEAKALCGEIKLWKQIPAADLWKKMVMMLFETGHPWITWKDPSNIRSPQDHVGVVHNSNLCTEITLNTSFEETAVCNLGSLNFAKFVKDKKFDDKKAAEVTKIAVRMLDNIIDINFYPTEDAERSNMKHRPIGLGIRGLHDALFLLGLDYDSEEAVDFSDQSMETVAYHAILSSSELAAERGSYETYKGSKWDRGLLPQDTVDLLEKERGEAITLPRGGKLDWKPVRDHIKKHGMRNSNCMAIAPTATTANIVGCIPSTEPIYKNLYVKSNQAGNFVVTNDYLIRELKTLGLWDKSMLNKIKFHDGSVQEITEIPENIRMRYKEVFEMDPKWIIDAAARRSKWIDQSQSLNIFFNGTSGKALSDIYFYAWRAGIKTTYYLRTLGASQVEKSTISTAEFGQTHNRAAVKQPNPIEAAKEEHLKKVAAGEAVGICESCEG